MLRSATGFVALYALLRWLKPRWVRLAFLVISLVLISYSHSEYIRYVEITADPTSLAFSYQLKYALIVIVLVSFSISLKFMPSKNISKSDSKKLTSRKKSVNMNDGFDFLRDKKELDSRSDKILKK
jgi:hypothetical protein